MIKEGRGINNNIKEEVNKIWDIFLKKSYSTHNMSILYNDKIEKEYKLEFVKRNNYYSYLHVDKYKNCTISIGVPINGKENKTKELITHELTHLIEIIGLQKKKYPKYYNIKKSLISYESKSKVIDLIVHCIYKTLDNEINANVAQTYTYLDGFGYMSSKEYLEKLKEFSEWEEYNNILNISKDNVKSKVSVWEIKELNDIFLLNNVKTIKNFNIDDWFDFWFNIFNKKSNLYLRRSKRIISEIVDKYKHFENYDTIPKDYSIIMDYSEFISNK